MTYSYNDYSSSDANSDLWNKVQNKLNSLNKYESASAMIASSDQKGDDARSVIFYCDSEAPDSSNLDYNWNYKVFSTDTNYSDMYKECLDFLNGNKLSDAQKYYARISMTNSEGHNSNLIVWYRSQN